MEQLVLSYTFAYTQKITESLYIYSVYAFIMFPLVTVLKSQTSKSSAFVPTSSRYPNHYKQHEKTTAICLKYLSDCLITAIKQSVHK